MGVDGIEEVVIVGGGVAGLATALALKRVGVKALVLERSDELRVTGSTLTLASNAWIALESLGVSHKLASIYPPLEKSYVTNVANGVTREASLTPRSLSEEGSKWFKTGPRTVHRRTLLEALADELPVGTIRFSSKLRCIEAQQTKDETTPSHSSSNVILSLEDGTTILTKVLIGCDGVHSVVGKWLGLKNPVNSGRCSVRGLAIFPEGHRLKQFQQFVDQGRRCGIITLDDRTVYLFYHYQSILIKHEEMASSDPKLIQKNVLEDLAHFPPIVHEVINHFDLSTLSWAPLVFRYPWDLIFGQVSKGTVTIAGDAMHPMTPDLGQGGGCALEDAVILGRHIGNSFIRNGGKIMCDDIQKEMKLYAKERKWRTAILITASYISGWVQQGGGSGGGWFTKFIRDSLFYKFFPRVVKSAQYDCGALPTLSTLSSGDDYGHNKND